MKSSVNNSNNDGHSLGGSRDQTFKNYQRRESKVEKGCDHIKVVLSIFTKKI